MTEVTRFGERTGTGAASFRCTACGEMDRAEEIVSGEAPDPAELRRIDWELAPFYCADCGRTTCSGMR